VLLVLTASQAGEKPRGEIEADNALIYFIQPDGSKHHLFTRQEWLGVLVKDAYFFTHLDPGEHFIWVDDARAFLSIYVFPGSTNYLRISPEKIEVADPQTGEALLAAAGRYSPLSESDRQDSTAKLKKYRKAYTRALRAGMFEPCKFAAEKRAEYDRRVQAGDPQASHILGNLYWYGECVERNYAKAIGWYEDAARKGHAGAMVTLGNIYYRGTNVEKKPAESAVWYLMAAEQGDLFSQRRLAEMYREGHGVDADTEEAIKWYRRAAEEGNDEWSLVQLETIDPATRELKRLQAEAEAHAAEEKKRKLEEQQQQVREKRLARISSKYEKLAINVQPLERAAKLQPPSRKEPVDDGSAVDSSVAYMLPPQIALGVVALSMVFNAVEKSLDSRLSSEEKAQIEAATAGLSLMLSEEPVSKGLADQIVAAGTLPGEDSLFIVAPGPDTTGADGNDDIASPPQTDIILEVETKGIGLMLANERFRKSHFVMSSRVQVRRAIDSVILKDRTLCYASSDTPKFSQWAADEGQRIREELVTAYASIADTILLILADQAYSTNTRNNELCEALLVTVKARKAALEETDR
jgi:TPR repeat protein